MTAPRRTRTRALAWLVACAPLASSLASCSEEGGRGPGRPNVLLVVVDTLRRDRLSCYGHERTTSPNIDRFAASAVRYTDALSQAPWTTPSVGALFTSRYPSALGIRSDSSVLGEDRLLLAEVLRQAGYATAAVVSHSFCSSAWGFDQGFERFDESNVLATNAEIHAAVSSPDVTRRGLALLDELEASGRPWFLWLHYFDPHCTYVEHERHAFGGAGDYAGPVRSRQPFRELKAIETWSRADLAELERIYDSEIAFTDAALAPVLERVAIPARRADTLVVVTADHGEEFRDHGGLGHARSLHVELVSVPLIVRYPGGAPGIDDGLVGLVDLFPTVLDVARIPPPAGLEGVSLAPGAPRDPRRILFTETERRTHLVAAVSASHKLVSERGRPAWLYDREADPREAAPLAPGAAAGTEGERLLSALRAFRERMQAEARPAPTIELGPDELERLHELGYGGAE